MEMVREMYEDVAEEHLDELRDEVSSKDVKLRSVEISTRGF